MAEKAFCCVIKCCHQREFAYICKIICKLDMKKIICVMAALAVAAGIADARKVKGVVTCGVKFLEGVVVTDGSSFTATNFKGQYALDVKDDAEYVYIVTPAGYVADWSSGVPAFYQAAAGKKIDFDLHKTA
jgi:hypothetical protein